MPYYEIKPNGIAKIDETTFSEVGLKERSDLQRLLRAQIDVIDSDLLVIAEEFGDWQESRRRIDLLALDKDADLVVIELKRTEDGGHMELQAVRYAAMVSAMTFDQAIEVYHNYLKKIGSDANARESILEFLEWEEPDEDSFAQEVRLLLVSAEFSKELTSSVLWLNNHGLDIRCIRLKPYKDGDRILIDVQQVLPLPEAQEYMVSIREKASKERIDRVGKGVREQLCLKFWDGLLKKVRAIEDAKLFSSISPSRGNWVAAGAGITNVAYNYVVRKSDAGIQFSLYDTNKDRNKAYYDLLLGHKSDIEERFGGNLEWLRRDDGIQSYIRYTIEVGGLTSEELTWPKIQDTLIDAMIRLEKAISPYIPELRKL